MAKTLYICYFGVREPLVQTQVIPYLLEIAKDEIEVTLLTFEPNMKEKWTAEQIESERVKLSEKGIAWLCRAYHKSPSVPATAYDIFSGAWYIGQLLRKEKYDVLHGRVHIPTLIGALARKLSKHKPKLLFDIRGFFPEEYTDAGVWPENGWLYRSAKRVEKWLLEEADGFVVLTEKAREILFPESKETGFDRFERPVEVIPCCVDIEKFKTANEFSRREARAELEIGDRRVIAYVGSFGGWYLTDEMLELFAAAKKQDPNSFALIFTQRDTESIKARLREKGFSDSEFYVGSVTPGELPKYLSAADAAVSFIKACYSKQSSSPTKIAEYLACGLPIIANRGVGDIDLQLGGGDVGVLLDGFEEEKYASALGRIEELGDVANICRETAAREFDLETVGGIRYRRMYSRLLESEELV
ncbi:MAG: glycosyltransferase family 4 protein [Acidobacteriota bacterium]